MACSIKKGVLNHKDSNVNSGYVGMSVDKKPHQDDNFSETEAKIKQIR